MLIVGKSSCLMTTRDTDFAIESTLIIQPLTSSGNFTAQLLQGRFCLPILLQLRAGVSQLGG
jgi:hypothetical protein